MDLTSARATLAGHAAARIARLPRPLLRAACGAPPPAAAGLAADAWALARLGRLTATPDVPLPRQRRLTDAFTRPLTPELAPHVGTVEGTVPGPAGPLAVQTYVPPDAPAGGPLLVWLHGGGWVFRGLASHAPGLRFLAATAGVRVASVEYRLAPEHPFPAPLEDALAAWRAIAADPERFGGAAGHTAIGGDSAGANLAAAVALAARDGAAPAPRAQILAYPICDVPGEHPSYSTFADGFGLTGDGMRWYFERYAGPDPAAWTDPRIAVARADLAGVAPAHVATALADPLRDEAEAYAAALAVAGVPVTTHRHPLLHGFLTQTAAPSVRDAVAQLGGVVAATLTPAGGGTSRSSRR